jgi:hypothetical protein
MTSSVPPPIGPRRRSRGHALDRPGPRWGTCMQSAPPWIWSASSAASKAARWVAGLATVTSLMASWPRGTVVARCIGHGAAGLELQRHLGHLVADGLEVADLAAERVSLQRVGDLHPDHPLHRAHGAQGQSWP